MEVMTRRNIYLSRGQIDLLEGMDNLSVSEHIRRAIDEYIQKKRESTTSQSPSQKGENA